MANEKKSILKEALTDFNEIMEAADANAKKKLAAEFPEKFNNLLKEELQSKNKKESYKKLDENNEPNDLGKTNESMKKQVKETVTVTDTVGTSDPYKEKAKGIAPVKEDVKITNTTDKNAKPFTDKAKGAEKIDEEREKDFVGDVESDTPNQGKGEAEKGNTFTEKLKGPTSGKPMSNIKEEFDITSMDSNSVGSALENAEEDDQIITMDEIENEISSMGDAQPASAPAQTSTGNQGGAAYQDLLKLRDNLQEVIDSMGVNEMHQGNFDINKMHQGQYNSKLVDEAPITEEDINAVIGSAPEAPIQEAPVVDEAMGISHSDGTITPGKLGDHEGTHGRFRQVGESEKKLNGLIDENKKLTKKLNESKKQEKEVTSLLESYKTALEKYRNQLKEMAVFNTNLAHVNNILVNEELALTQEDKIRIINEFKQVDNIGDSQKKYTKIISEMKESRKTISESVEEKVSTSIQPSSKQKLDEVIEKTAYADDAHMAKMKKLIKYVENRGKK